MGQDTVFPHVAFMHGGYYQLCYSPDGSMGSELNAIVPVQLRVFGVSSECEGNGCLALERWDCFFSYRYEANSVCRVDFRSARDNSALVEEHSGWVAGVGLGTQSWANQFETVTNSD